MDFSLQNWKMAGKPDPKPAKRIVAYSAVERKMDGEVSCRACGIGGKLEPHHCVPRAQRGDDVPDNIVALCGPCHHSFTHTGGETRRQVAERIRRSLSRAEIQYIIGKKSREWFDRKYPWNDAISRTRPPGAGGDADGAQLGAEPSAPLPSGGVLSEEEKRRSPSGLDAMSTSPASPVGTGGLGCREMVRPDPTSSSESISPGEDCPTCGRKVPHPRKPSSPKSKPFSFRIPEEEREAFEQNVETVEKIIGVYERPHSHFQLIVALLGYALLNEDELRGFLGV